MKRLACFVLLVACGYAQAAPGDDLLSVYADAHANNPALREAVAQAGAAGADAGIARASLLPQWTLDLAPQRSEGVRSTTTTSRVSQALIDVAALDTWKAARADASAQDANLRAAEQALMAEVAVRYFALLTAQSQLVTLVANEGAFRELVRQSEVRVKERLSAAVDVDQARAYLGLAQGATQQAREGVADACQAVQELTGHAPAALRPLREDFRPAAPQPAAPAAWTAEALANHPLLQAGSASVAAAEERIGAARAAHLPTLDLSFVTQRAPIDTLAASPQTTNNVLGLRLTVPLLAGGATLAQQKRAVYTRDNEAARLEAQRRNIVRNVQAQWQAAQGSVVEIATAQAAAQAAERSLAATRAGHQYGTRSLFDVLNAIQTNGQAQLELIQARNRHVVALLLLKQAAGRLSIDDLVGVNGLLARLPVRIDE